MVVLVAVLGVPFAITLCGPYSMMSELTAASGGGPRLAISILNLAIVKCKHLPCTGLGYSVWLLCSDLEQQLL